MHLESRAFSVAAEPLIQPDKNAAGSKLPPAFPSVCALTTG